MVVISSPPICDAAHQMHNCTFVSICAIEHLHKCTLHIYIFNWITAPCIQLQSFTLTHIFICKRTIAPLHKGTYCRTLQRHNCINAHFAQFYNCTIVQIHIQHKFHILHKCTNPHVAHIAQIHMQHILYEQHIQQILHNCTLSPSAVSCRRCT